MLLLRSYKCFTALAQVKDENNVTGTDRKSCSFFDKLDSVLGTGAASCPPVLIDSSVGVGQDGSSTPGHATTSDCTPGIIYIHVYTTVVVTINS